MLVKELDKHRFKKIDSRFYDSLPKYCEIESCGFPIEINEVLNEVKCSNIRCPKKIAKRVENLGKKLDIHIDYKDALNYVLINDVKTPIYLFKSQASLKIAEADRAKLVNQMTLVEYIENNMLPFLSDTLKIIQEYITLDDFYEDLESDGIEFLEKNLSLYVDEEQISLRALKAFDVLMTFKQDLYDGLSYVEIIEEC